MSILLSTDKKAKTILLQDFKIKDFKTYNKRLQNVLRDLKHLKNLDYTPPT